MKSVILAAVVISLTGCASGSFGQQHPSAPAVQKVGNTVDTAALARQLESTNFNTVDVGHKPEKYKKHIKKAIRFVQEDPEATRFSDFTPLRKEALLDKGRVIYGYSTCVYVNSKNASGEYGGDVLYWVFMRNNEILRIKNTQNASGKVIFAGRNIRCD